MLQRLKIVHNECVQVSANVFKMCDTMFTITHFFLIYVYIYMVNRLLCTSKGSSGNSVMHA